MKTYFTLFLILIYSLSFSQNISIKQFDKIDITKAESLAKYLAAEIPKQYEEKNKPTYFDTSFRISVLAGKYDLALKQLDSLRDIYMKSSPENAKVMGAQFEIYIKTIANPDSKNNFENVYKNEFKKKYEELPIKSQIILPVYFEGDGDKIKKDLVDLLQKDFAGKDSVDIATAIKLCRTYLYYTVFTKSYLLGNQYIKVLDDESFTVKDSILIKGKSNNNISIRVVLNNKLKNPESTIVTNTIYADDNNIISAKENASHGYHAVYIYTRGKYLSNNKIEPFEHEQEDINVVLDWIVKQPWSNGKVGMIGGSYDGFTQWAATKKIHPALKTIIPQVSAGAGAADFPLYNGIYSTYTLRWLNFVTNNKTTDALIMKDEEKWNSLYKKWYQSGLAFNKLDSIEGKKKEMFQRWLQHPTYDEYWKKMVPVKEEYSKINIPVLTTTGYFEGDQMGALHYLKEHYKYNKNANHYLIIGPYDHSGGAGLISSELLGYKIDPVAQIDMNEIGMQWFDYILKGKNKPAFLKDKINYQVMGTNEWKHTSSLEKFNENHLKFYLEKQDDQLILSESIPKKEEFSKLMVNFKDRSDADFLVNLEQQIVDSTIYVKNYLTFSTPVFDKPFEFTGNFSGTLNISVNKKDVDLEIKLYELLPDGTYFSLTNFIGRASYFQNPEKRMLLTPNKKTSLKINRTLFVSKKIEKGSRLIAVVGIVKSPFWEINYGTGKDVSTESMKDAGEPLQIKFYNDSYIEIPVLKN